jgi:hypothetical protein
MGTNRPHMETTSMPTLPRTQIIIAAALCGLVCMLTGCGTVRPSTPAGCHLVEGFEQCGLWSIDSANNFGEVRYALDKVTSGEYALEATFFDSGRANTIFRKEVDYDLSGVQSLWVDIFNTNAQPGVACALAFGTEQGTVFETRAAELASGWNRDVRFRLDAGGMVEGTDSAAWTGRCSRVNRLMLYALPGNNAQGTLHIDNLRADRMGVNRRPRPRLHAVQTPTEPFPQGTPVELTLTFDSHSLQTGECTGGNPESGNWAPAEVLARFTAPDGQVTDISGFLKAAEPEGTNLLYAARFTPPTPGTWHVDVGYRAERKWQSVGRQALTVLATECRNGSVGIAAEDPSSFELASGEAFYPIGQNVCWSGDYEPYLRRMQEYGGNLVRVWVCPWNFPLLKNSVDSIDLAAAAEIDSVMELANECGIHVQLVLAYHGWFKDDWGRNPFNAELGGPLMRAAAFWHDGEARRAFKAYMDYAVRRWSACPNLFAWELMNEVDLVPYDMESDVVEWHREMAAHLKATDPAGHLVTTSVSGGGALSAIWEIPEIDFCTSHMYSTDVDNRILEAWREFAPYGKPYFIGEIGRGYLPADDQVDPEGHHLHHALWLAYMTPSAGNCLPWWWDTHIQPNSLERHYPPLVAFNRGEDRRGMHYRGRTAQWQEGNADTVKFQGIVTRHSVFGFIYSEKSFTDVGLRSPAPLLRKTRRLEFANMEDGPYELEIWNTYDGNITRQRHLICVGGRLIIPLPPAARDFAFKVKQCSTVTRPAAEQPAGGKPVSIRPEESDTKSLLSDAPESNDSSPALAGGLWDLPTQVRE